MKNKRLISWILTVVMIVSVLCSVQISAFAAGVEVATADELAKAVADKKPVIVITADISVSETLVPKVNTTFRGKGSVKLSGTCETFIRSEGYALTIDNLTVTGATDSAVVTTGGALTISNSVFTGNSGTNGGAVRSSSKDTMTVINSVFEKNTAAENGGAVMFYNPNTLVVKNSIFSENKAENEGGAIYAFTEWNVMQFTGTTFSGNSAKGGGAIRNVNGSVEAWDSAFTANKATEYHGGAIYGWHLYNVFHDCTISKNTAAGNGGAVWVETTDSWPDNQYANIIVHSGSVSDNSAGYQGGALGGQNLPYGITVDTGAVISGNKATEAGALYNWAGVYISDSTLKNNTATQNGGAIWSNWEVKCNNVTITGNKASWYGGAVYSMVGDITFNNCTIKNNVALPEFGGAGGVASDYSMSIYVNSCTVSGNRAYTYSDFHTPQGKVIYGEAPVDAAPGKKNVINVSVSAEDGLTVYKTTVSGASEANGVFTVVSAEGEPTEFTVSTLLAKERTCKIESFEDIRESMSIHKAVDYVVSKGLMNGISTEKFEPDTYASRGMIVATLYRFNGSPAVEYKNSFKDVPDGQWFTSPVLWAAENKIVEGYNGKFGAVDLITYEQLATILYRYANMKNYDTTSTSDLVDTALVSNYAVEPVKWAVSIGMISGNADFGGYVTRGELASVLYAFGTEYSL